MSLNDNDHAFNNRLAETIKQYWIKRGYEAPRIQIIDCGFSQSMRSGHYGIRSNMVNGLPLWKAQ